MSTIYGIKKDTKLKLTGDLLEKEINGKNYSILYDGTIYNIDNIKAVIGKENYETDAEVLLDLFVSFGEKMLAYLNGDFAFAIYDGNTIFIARDKLGVKPMYYSQNGKSFVFASSIKDILNSKVIEPIMSKEEFLEMIALGPAHTPSKTYFKNIFELEAGNYLVFDNNCLKKVNYWDLKEKKLEDSEKEIITNIKELVTDSTKIRMKEDISSTLSGGLDSTIVTKLASDFKPGIKTYSINYEENDEDFKASSYQQSKDSDYVKVASGSLDVSHTNLDVTQKELFDSLRISMDARSMPGMADIDSSMYVFCKKLSQCGERTTLSGECSDEIFAGYPWFYREHLKNANGFPWALSENLRQNLIKKGLVENEDVNNYILTSKQNTLKRVEHISSSPFENEFKEINYLTIKYFMNTLIERTERTARLSNLDVRMPFSDYRIFEYVYTITGKDKLGLNVSSTPTEKCLLRFAFKDDIPISISQRKKSPFPKTYSRKYLEFVEEELRKIIDNPASRIHEILNIDYIRHIMDTHGEELSENLFGQLMTYPQTLAYIIQIEYWLEDYNIKVEI